PSGEFADSPNGTLGGVEGFLGEIKLLAIANREHEMAECGGTDSGFSQVGDAHHVADALGHFLAIGEQEFAMAPEAREGDSTRPFRLGDFIFVVWENEIDAAPMNIEGVTEVFPGHRGALEVPAGSAAAPG